jgi:hypothetical protein
MGIIATSDLRTILDKIARYCGEAASDPDIGSTYGFAAAAGHVLSGSGAIDTFILTLTDRDQIADLLPAARDLDENNPTAPATIISQAALVKAFMAALDIQCARFGYKNLDGYLTFLNTPTPTLRTHGLLRRYLGAVSAANNFLTKDQVIATFTATGAATGTYAHVAAVDATQYGPHKLRMKNVTVLTSAPTVTVTAKKPDGTTSTLTATISTLTINTETDLSDTGLKFVDVTNITIAGSTSGDEVEVIAKSDRSVASA